MSNLLNRMRGNILPINSTNTNNNNNNAPTHYGDPSPSNNQFNQSNNDSEKESDMDVDIEIEEVEVPEISTPRELTGSVSDTSLTTLNDLRLQNLLCDAVICCNYHTNFHIHRAVMSAVSPYFRAQFTGFNNISNPTQCETNRIVSISGVPVHIMEQIINYAYIRKCNIDEKHICELLTAADYFGMTGLVNLCKDELIATLKPESAVGIMGFAKFRCLHDLYESARDFTLRYFMDVAAKSKEILQIGLADFYDIISDDELNTREEDHVWKLCVKWIDVDPDIRKKHVAQLMQGVRMGLMTPKCFMEEVKEHPYVMQCDEAKPLIVETFKFMYDLELMNPMVGAMALYQQVTTPPLAMPRMPHEVIFAIGGWSGGTSKGCIETYDTRADRWVNIPAEDPAGPRAYHGTAVIGHKIYTIGGYDGVEYFNTCRVFNCVTKGWTEIAPMHSRRCYVSVAELNGMIYAIGGYDGHNRLNTVERYNPKTNQWSLITPMNMQRSDASACTLRGKIYATGGFNGQECLDSAEYFDPNTNNWTRIPNMNHRRSGVSCVAFRGHLYVIGGFNGTARLATGERFDPDSQSWSFIREMNHSRSNFGLEIIDEMIFAIGGFNGVSTISHTECYVPETDEWMEATDMNIVRSALTANNVAGLPNKRDYIHKERDRLMEERRQRLLATAFARESEALAMTRAATLQVPVGHYDEDEDLELMDDFDERNLHQNQNRNFRAQIRGAVSQQMQQQQQQRHASHHEMRRRA